MEITEDYVSVETAKLLKEKSFNGICRAGYTSHGNLNVLQVKEYLTNQTCPDTYWACSAPTLQMSMKWLREVHNKHCDIGYDIDLEWYFQIIDLKETVEYDYPEPNFFHAKNEIGFKTYEEAVEAALKYTLENLI